MADPIVRDASSPNPTPPREIRRRVSGDERRRLIVETAARIFAEDGFVGSTREIASRLGVTQALLYRYFASKEALIDAVFDHVRSYWSQERSDVLRQSAAPLATRMCLFYQAYLLRPADFSSARLFMHAALAGMDLAIRYATELDRYVLLPIINAMRNEVGATEIALPLPAQDRELALGLHGALIFIGIRRYIYGAPIDDARHLALVNDLIHIWLPGALARIKLSCDNL